MAEKKKYNSILASGRKDETLTYSRYVKDEDSGESVKESLDKKVNTTDKLETQQINDGAITNEKIKDKNVTNEKLADNSVSTSKIALRSVTNEKIAYNAVSRAELTTDVRSSIDKKADAEQVNNSLRNLEEKIGNRIVVEGNVTNLPDEEDLVSVNKDGQYVLKFSDKAYNPENFSGKGYVILRKNIQPVKFKTASININSVGTTEGNLSFKIMNKTFNVPFDPIIENTVTLIAEKIATSLADSVYDFDISSRDNEVSLVHTVACDTPDIVFMSNSTGVEATVLMSEKTEVRNVLTQAMISKQNTIYEVRYDFDVIGPISTYNIKFVGNGGSINFNRYSFWNGYNIVYENLKLINIGNPYNEAGIKSVFTKNCVFENKSYLQNQTFNAISINVLDYMQNVTTTAINASICFNLNNILDKIYSNFPKNNSYYINIVFPDRENGGFYVERPIVIKNGFKYDFKEATIITTKDYSYDHVVEYESNTKYNSIVTGKLKNAKFNISNTKKNLKTVFDLTNFEGTIENVNINLGKNTAFAYLQPVGTPTSSYSDNKRIIRCKVTSEYNKELELMPRTLFCFGDGCIIEQSYLNGIIIYGGKSYTFIGCLNDNYYLVNTNVNFEGNYWEIGQFRILNSTVNFVGCRMIFDNNLYFNNRNFKGSLFSIDTEEAKNSIFFALNKGLGMSNIRFENASYSTIGFYNNSLFYLTYWFSANKYSGKIFSIGKKTIIKNIDELAFQDYFVLTSNSVHINKIILNDTNFQYDLQRKSIDFSTSVFNVSNFSSKDNPTNLNTNFSWSSNVNIKADFYYVISEKKQIYRKIGTATGITTNGKHLCYCNINSNFTAKEDRFICAVTIDNKNYIVKKHIQEINAIGTFYKDTWDENIYKNLNLSTNFYFYEIEPGKYKCNEVECINNTELYDTLINNNFNSCNKCIVEKNGINVYTDKLPSFGEWEFGDRCTIGNVTYMYDGNNWNAISGIKGLTNERPSLQSIDEGFEYYDSTLKKKILWNGTDWVNLDGTEIS